MTITVEKNDLHFTIRTSGWLNTEAAPALGAEIEKIVKAESIVLDFKELEYISSSGIRQVVAAYKKAKAMDAEFSVINVGDDVMEVFKLTNLDKKIHILPLAEPVK
ncbi:MAG: STAS domain-containing protein [Clostridiaceae bacterium]|jgi:anti-sigma B factor antagonist|nr:STAS domain-containing protein [Clostridia bacterium]MBP6161327.1 STAS domain-containing protein [Clostridia bacterium]MBP6949365.1 STAS domain-containing protein [Clostridia bacterium]NMA35228.1 STAS domain-containing protein [Clostridiaceae bacterium]